MSTKPYGEAYIARCHRTLTEWGAPLDDWFVTNTYDCLEEANELFTCELCGCTQVRIVHVMEHLHYFERISVGCICAGIMEGDILAAKERERMVKNRAKRRKNYLKRIWEQTPYGVSLMRYRGEMLQICKSKIHPNQFVVCCSKKSTRCHKGKPITDFCSAIHAAFDLIDPVEEIWNA